MPSLQRQPELSQGCWTAEMPLLRQDHCPHRQLQQMCRQPDTARSRHTEDRGGGSTVVSSGTYSASGQRLCSEQDIRKTDYKGLCKRRYRHPDRYTDRDQRIRFRESQAGCSDSGRFTAGSAGFQSGRKGSTAVGAIQRQVWKTLRQRSFHHPDIAAGASDISESSDISGT